jgi:DNA modification methylase
MHTDAIYCGDCQKVLADTVEFPDKSVDLIYVDPPFFSNRYYEAFWHDGYELRSFEDRWKGGIENYISWMEPKVVEWQRLLKDTGSIYLHCDWHADAHLRLLLDKVFGPNRFLNEIAWCYETSGKSRRWFARKHDTIFLYSKGPKYTFNFDAVKVPRKANNHMRVGKTAEGRAYEEKTDRKSGKVYRWYLDQGALASDFWTDIKFINREAKERLHYPTQKPEALLDRIIKASSNPGDVVLDPMCGCGTAVAVARQLGRRWVGVDVSPTACKLMVKRMRTLGVEILQKEIVGMPKTDSQVRQMTPFEFQNWVFQQIQGRVSARLRGDMGIDGHVMGEPVQVKQSEAVGRNVVDNFRAAMAREKKTKGTIVALSFGSGAFEEVARLKNQDGVEITLKTLKEILNED